MMCAVFAGQSPRRLPDQRWAVNDERYCETLHKLRRVIQNSGAGCLVPVLSCCTITLGHTRPCGQLTSCRSSSGRCLIIHPIARISRPVISIFSYTSRNSCSISVSVFRTTERRRWVSHSGSNLKVRFLRYKIVSHGMTNVSIPVVNMLKNNSKLALYVPINISIKGR